MGDSELMDWLYKSRATTNPLTEDGLISEINSARGRGDVALCKDLLARLVTLRHNNFVVA